MKRNLLWLAILLCLLLSGCSSRDGLQYSNLTDTKSREIAARVMTEAGISEERQTVFFDHVDQINAVIGEEYLTKSFTSEASSYDPYLLQDLWTNRYPDFLGYNCRITSFGLFSDFLRIDPAAEKRDLFLSFDMDSLHRDPSVLFSDDDLDAFRVLYSTIPAEDSTDIQVHVKTVQDDWKNRGIRFDPPKTASLISVFFHDKLSEDECELFIGHTGILFEAGKGQLYFIEKLAFQEPYQLLRLTSRDALYDYLMGKYDPGEGPTARPFIMENDELLSAARS